MDFEANEIIKIKQSKLNPSGDYMIVGFFTSSDDCFYSIRHLETGKVVVRSIKDMELEEN